MYKNLTLNCFLAFAVIFFSCTPEKFETKNKVPLADAGIGKSITLPMDTVTLSGTGSDEDGHVIAYLWSQVTGPSPTTIANPGSASTLIKNSMAGRYVFQLAVTDDKGATGVDTVSVVINPSVIKTLIIETSNNPNDITLVNYNGNDETSHGIPDIPIQAWTKNGLPFVSRQVIKFDFNSIPINATILNANLFLYSYPPPTQNGNLVDANFGSNNSFLIQQIVSSWSPASINWFNQPQTSTLNQILVASTTQSVLDLNINITNMISAMVKNNANYGFLLKIQNEQIYNSRLFISSHNTVYTSKRPKLVIQYQ